MIVTNRLLRSVAVSSLIAISGSNAFAIALGDSGTGVNSIGAFQSGSGGEFYFQPALGLVDNSSYANTTRNQGGYAGSFQTFCLERGEWLAQGSVNYVVNDEAVGGGANYHGPAGNQGGDRLSIGTAWLYSQFAQGILSGYDYSGSGRTSSAGLLQHAIWALEDELTDPSPGSNIFFDLAMTHGGQDNYTSGLFGVWVLNNTAGTTKKQDMLFYGAVPSAGGSVPDGGSTLILLGLAAGGLSVMGRQKKSPQAT